jgi:putative CocE/NonD family hydrolase
MLDRPVPMRDGMDLSADIWLPPTGDRFPALLIRTPYNNADARFLAWADAFVAAGYAVVLQDCRGRHDSDGVWDPYVCELEDGYDTHQWVGAQPWCDGQIGTWGLSYPGFTQTLPATLRSPHLKALVPIASQQDNWGHHRVGGAIQWSVTVFFAGFMGRTMQMEPIARLDQDALLRGLPLATAVETSIGRSDYVRGVIEHDGYDDWWSRYSLRDQYGEVDAPAYFMTGWYDSLLDETLTVFQGWKAHARSSEARRLTRILVGPWSHQVAPWGRKPLGPDGEFEDVAFGAHAVGDNIAEHLRWYDARLRGRDTGIDAEPPVRLFVMGANQWRSEQEWPLARTRWTDLFLAPGGQLTFDGPPDEGAEPDRFTYDPADPVPSWGAQYQSMDLGGPRDRRVVEARDDVLVFDSPVLDGELEVTGPIALHLWAMTDAPDTDWTAALVDVFPDGRAIILCEGICRARFREPLAPPTLVPADTPTEFVVNLWATANVFGAGHRVRLEVSSSNFPRFDRNLNTGGRVGFETEWRVAHQAVFHDRSRPSHLVLPVIPPG